MFLVETNPQALCSRWVADGWGVVGTWALIGMERAVGMWAVLFFGDIIAQALCGIWVMGRGPGAQGLITATTLPKHPLRIAGTGGDAPATAPGITSSRQLQMLPLVALVVHPCYV